MRLVCTVAAMVGALLFAPSTAAGQSLSPPPPSPEVVSAPPTGAAAPAPVAPQLTASDLEAWLDGFLPYALQRGNIAGAVVVVVKDGRVLLQKGYGYSDVAMRTPVDPARTLFRPGSVSKLFTWTAVMQLVERGKLDLDADVNSYLDFKIPPRDDGRPITLRDIMTHTTGFEDMGKGLIVTEGEAVPSLQDAVKRWIPERIFPAGATPTYSNYATGLAGYLIERTSGLGFEDYVDRNIFEPLRMTHSTFRHPLPEGLAGDVSRGYKVASGDPQPYEIVPLKPAGHLATTAHDMAAFMIAHLRDGAYGDARILAPETARLMHQTSRRLLPPLRGMALGFFESDTNGHRAIGHGGATQYFHSMLQLYPDDGIGLFISVNSAGKDGAGPILHTAFIQQFSDRYLPGPRPEGSVDPRTAAEHARMIAGVYESSRRLESSLLSIMNLLLGQATVMAHPDGTISVAMIRGLNDEPKTWREISPFVWAEVDGGSRLAAQVVDGEVVRFSVDEFSPAMVFDRARTPYSSAWLLPALIASLGALLLTVFLWPVRAIVRRHHGREFPLTGRDARAYRLSRIGAAVQATVILAWLTTMGLMLFDRDLMSSKLDGWLRALHLVGAPAVFIGLAFFLGNAWVVWRGQRTWPARLWSVVLVLSGLVMVWLTVAFKLVGIGVNY